jgi:hypothetical protein
MALAVVNLPTRIREAMAVVTCIGAVARAN